MKIEQFIKNCRRRLSDSMLVITESLKEVSSVIRDCDVLVMPANADDDSVSIREALCLGTSAVPSDAVPLRPKPLGLLLIGPLPPPIGGVTVLFECLTQGLSSRADVKLTVINTSGIPHQMSKLGGLFKGIVCRIIREIPRADVVSLHTGTPALAVVGPAVLVMARIWRKPLIIRKFDGTDYRDYGVCRRVLIRWALRGADLYLAETKMLVKAAKEDGIEHVEWYPNNRPFAKEKTPMVRERKCCRRFVYLGHIRPYKGINEIIQAAERFDQDVSVDVYGLFFKDFPEEAFKGLRRVRYCGVVPPETVVKTLEQYDALLLPTHHIGEGYPGVILEAYRAGLPVICTHWRALPEIVDESCGLLVKPYSVDELHEAMRTFVRDDQLYGRLCKGALKKQELFDSHIWVERFVEYCKALAEGVNFRNRENS